MIKELQSKNSLAIEESLKNLEGVIDVKACVLTKIV